MGQRRGEEQAQDEIDEVVEPGSETANLDEAGQQDFGARNVIMSNALQGGASPASGAVIGSGGELGMEPPTDEAEIEAEGRTPAEEREEGR